MNSERKPWSRIITHRDVTVRLYERGRVIWRAVIVGRVASKNGKSRAVEDRKSLGHGDRKLAEEQAKALCGAIAMQQLSPRDVGDELTLGKLFAAYQRLQAPSLSAQRRQFAASRVEMFLLSWGSDLLLRDVCQTQADAYVQLRRTGALMPAGVSENDLRRRGVRDGTLDSDFRWLSSVFNWAYRHKLDGRRLLNENPLADVTWPKEKNVRRPIATQRRFLRTLEHCDAVDPRGRLRCVLSLARYTGRRESAICTLTADNVLLSIDRVAVRLAELGRDEGLAEHMPHGAIHWPGDTDKEGVERVTPLSAAARAALDAYLRLHPSVGPVPIFPAEMDASKHIPKATATAMLLRAEKLAGLPKLAGGAYHPYRRLWASERAELPDIAVAEGGGWKSATVMRASYQRADGALLLAAVEGKRTG